MTNKTVAHSLLCKSAPLQLCRLTDKLGIADECKTKPLISNDTFSFERPAICVLGVIGFAICLGHTHSLYGGGYTAARAKMEYSIFFFSLAVWFGFSVIDHCFFTTKTTLGEVFVLVDVCSSLYSSFAICFASLCEIGIGLKVKIFKKTYRKVFLASVALGIIAIAAFFRYIYPQALEVIWLVIVVICVGTFSILAAIQFIRKHSVKLLLITAVLGAAEFAALVCLMKGNSLCDKVSRHFGGEEFFFLLTDISVFLFYRFYAWIKESEIDKLTKDVELDDGRRIKVVDEV